MTDVTWRKIDDYERAAGVEHATMTVTYSYEHGWQTRATARARHGYTGMPIMSAVSEGHDTAEKAQAWLEGWATDTGMI